MQFVVVPHCPQACRVFCGWLVAAAAKLALASLGGKIGTSFVKYLPSKLELSCTQLKQVLDYEGELPYMLAASQLSGKLGKDISLRHLQAYNDLTRILTCTTRPTRARKAADIPKPARCLTLGSIQQLLTVAQSATKSPLLSTLCDKMSHWWGTDCLLVMPAE